ncbi:MAG: cobalamin-independent methionine synthase II family protein [Chloroflexota bacterium]
MIRSTDRIRVTHQGTLPAPTELREMIAARREGRSVDNAALDRLVRTSVSEAVQRQVEIGIDSINDGEMSKSSFSDYVNDRLGGLAPTDEPYVSPISGRDQLNFPEYFSDSAPRFGRGQRVAVGMRRVVHQAVEPLTYTGQSTVQIDIENLKAAIQGLEVEEAYLPAVAPGSIEHWLKNAYYPNDEAFLEAIADAMHEEYQAIVDAGFLLQIDDPDLADGWQVHPGMDLGQYRKEASLRTDVLNHALRGIPRDRVRLHMCWGSYHGPHTNDLPLRDFVDIVLRINAGAFSIEAANPRHVHEYEVWEDVKLPQDTLLIPGVIGHYSDFVEHPELVAKRLMTYAGLVGRENVMAGTDCGIGSRVGGAEICWAKFEAMVEGARIASRKLFS